MFDIPKSASTSINFAIRKVSECILDGNGGIKHLQVREYEDSLLPLITRRAGLADEVMDRIAVVREPIDMLASYYKYLRRPGTEAAGHLDHHRHTGAMSFPQFCLAVMDELEGKSQRKFSVSRPAGFVCTTEGKVGIDTLFAFDRLQDFARYMTDKTGEVIDIPHRNVSVQQSIPQLPIAVFDRIRSVMDEDIRLYDRIKSQPEGQPLRIRGQLI